MTFLIPGRIEFWQRCGPKESILDELREANELLEDRRGLFQVMEGFRGINTATVEIHTGLSQSLCGYPFQKGHSYLVYAHEGRDSGKLHTDVCSRTRQLSKACEDLRYLPSIAEAPVTAWVAGVVSTNSGTVPGAAVRLESESLQRAVLTDQDGRYRFENLPPGECRLFAEVKGFTTGVLLRGRPLCTTLW